MYLRYYKDMMTFLVTSKSSLRGHQLKLHKKVLGSTLRNILLVTE